MKTHFLDSALPGIVTLAAIALTLVIALRCFREPKPSVTHSREANWGVYELPDGTLKHAHRTEPVPSAAEFNKWIDELNDCRRQRGLNP